MVLVLLAASVTATVTIPDDRIILQVSYNNFNDEDQVTIAQTATVTIQNTDPTEKAVKVVLSDLPAGYSANAIANVTVPANGSTNVQFTVNVPHKQGSGDTTIGTIILRDTANAELDRAVLVQRTKVMLELKELEVHYTDDDKKVQEDDFSSSDTEFKLDEKVRVGSEVTLKFRAKNLFDKNYDEDKAVIEDITLTLEPDDNDLVGDNFEEEYDLSDIDANKDEEITVTFTVPDNADAQSYTLDITLEGEDGEGFKYRTERELKIEVGRSRDDLRIIKAVISPAALTRCDEQFTLDFMIKNFGTKEQRYAGVSIDNPTLSINENIANLNVKEYDEEDKNSWNKLFSFPLPEGVRAGTYPLDIKVYVDRDRVIESQILNVEINGRCAAETEEIIEQPAPTQVENRTITGTTTTPTSPIVSTTATGSESDNTLSAGNKNTRTTTTETTTSTTPAPTSTVLKSIENPYTVEDLLVGLILAVAVFVIALIIIFFVLLIR